jgi:DNA-binding transcriptional ArsR family regulator
VTDLDAYPVRTPDAATLSAARRALPGDLDLANLTDLFRLLGDPTRARLLYALLGAEELCVCDLAAATRTAENTVSHALRLLRAAGVVAAERNGRMMYYRLADGRVRILLELTREYIRKDAGR